MGIADNEKVIEFIGQVCSNIKKKRIHNEIKLELINHIEELYEENIIGGMTEDKAVENALQHMGNGDVVGKELNKIHRQWPDWIIIGETALFTLFGVVLMYLIESKGALLHNFQIFSRSIFHVVLGLVVLVGINLFDYRHLKRFSKYIYGLTILAWLFVMNTGSYFSGGLHLRIWWISLSFMPMVVVLIVISLAGIFDGWNWNDKTKLIIAAGLVALPSLLFLLTPSLAYLSVYLVSVLLILWLSGLKLRYIILAFSTVMTMGIFYIIQRPYARNRLFAFLTPWKDPNGYGWINIQMQKVVKSTGIFGKGFDVNPIAVPDVHTDFVFTYIIYTFGWLVTGILIGFIVLFIIRMVRGLYKVNDSYGRLIAIGVIGILSTRFVWNILMTLGLLPIAGMPLPFISYGGSQLIMDMMMVGYLSNIYRRKEKTFSETVL